MSSSCLPLNCLACKKSSKNRLKPSLKLPTIKEFLRKSPNSEEEGRSVQSFSPRLSEVVSISPKSCSSPQLHRSTIVIRNGAVFSPLSIHEKSINNSIVSNIRQDGQEKTLFMSLQSFDKMFGKSKGDKKEGRTDPFVLDSSSKPKIIPITPAGWKKRRRTEQPKKIDVTSQKIFQENKSENLSDSLV